MSNSVQTKVQTCPRCGGERPREKRCKRSAVCEQCHARRSELSNCVPSADALKLLSQDQRAKLLLGIGLNIAAGYRPRLDVPCAKILHEYYADEETGIGPRRLDGFGYDARGRAVNRVPRVEENNHL